jgi:hypothetical protein
LSEASGNAVLNEILRKGTAKGQRRDKRQNIARSLLSATMEIEEFRQVYGLVAMCCGGGIGIGIGIGTIIERM